MLKIVVGQLHFNILEHMTCFTQRCVPASIFKECFVDASDIRNQIAEFWGCDNYQSYIYELNPIHIDPEINMEAPMVLAKWVSNCINPSTLWEFCEYFRIKYPANKVRCKMSEMVLAEYDYAKNIGNDIRIWASKYYSHNVEQLYSSRIVELLEVYTIFIVKIRKSMDDLVPHMFRAADKHLQLRYRALHSACLFEIRMRRAFISGIKASLAEEIQ